MGINTKYNHDNLDGSDCISYYITDYDAYMNSLEHTLTKSGIAWIIDHTHTLFYYGTKKVDDKWVEFEYCEMPNDLDIKKVYSWCDFEDVVKLLYDMASMGDEIDDESVFDLERQLYLFFDLQLCEKINILKCHYNIEKVFGKPTGVDTITYSEIEDLVLDS